MLTFLCFMCFLNFVFSLNLKWHCLHFYKYFDLLLKPLSSFSIFGLILIFLSFLMCVLKFLLSESKMFTFYNYYDLPLKQVQSTFDLKLSRRIDCGGTSRKVSSFYVCTQVVLFDIHRIALFANFITQVDLPLLRWSWMVPEGTKKSFVLSFVLNVACRVKSLHCGPISPIETSCVLSLL